MDAHNQTPGDQSPTQYNSHLFTVRIWQEAISQTQAEWRGRLQYVPSGEVLYFRNWDTLIQHIVSMLPGGGEATLQIAGGEGKGRESEPTPR